MNIMVLGAGGNAGINFIKSLRMSSNSYFILGVDQDQYNLFASNADQRILAPRFESTEQKLSWVKDLVEKFQIQFIHAQPDREVEFLLQNQMELSRWIFNHSYEEWKKFADKLYCQNHWDQRFQLGFRRSSLSELLEDEARWGEFSQGLDRFWVRAVRGAGSKAALPVASLDQARSWAQYWVDQKGLRLADFMVSEFLPGREFAVQSLWNEGQIVHMQARQRLVYFFGNIMPSGQSSTPAVAATCDLPEVYEMAENAIRSISSTPHGIYCVDLKENRAGRVVPMEVNYGRFFTTSDFFARLGVNSPDALVRIFRGESVSSQNRSIRKKFYWLRGLDKEPMLATDEELSRLESAPPS